MLKRFKRNEVRKNRHKRVRQKVYGTPERPRLNVYRSNSHIYAQIINDINGHTLVSASTLDKALVEKLSSTGNKEAARLVGELVGKRAIDKGINEVVFDRAGYLYHGKIKELAEGAREAGLKF
ncbi:50S ribosomal protein L18 [Schnuerera sp. xch1]|uniref:50S ribosomal protein L18 n=1 Tax=Schnuerera sp. xch1 TaxID=2874283 RepID=UPI001CBA738E|nr:50S ribosomal protein L18 [Schnuerera sp. xch1]MBZ2175250.1 50S ribosomal protein L18 [Schnuerera sp. xch1]